MFLEYSNYSSRSRICTIVVCQLPIYTGTQVHHRHEKFVPEKPENDLEKR